MNLPDIEKSSSTSPLDENSFHSLVSQERTTLNPNAVCFDAPSEVYKLSWPELPPQLDDGDGGIMSEIITPSLSQSPSKNDLTCDGPGDDSNYDAPISSPAENADGNQPEPEGTGENSPIAFNLYQRQSQIYANLHHLPVLTQHSVPVILPPTVELQGQILFNLETDPVPSATGTMQIHSNCSFSTNQGMPFLQQMHGYHDGPVFENYNVSIPPPVFYGYPVPDAENKNEINPQHRCCSGGEQVVEFQTPQKDNISNLPIKIPSWAKLTLEEEEENDSNVFPISSSSSSRAPRLVEYIGDQYHSKNPHTRRTILLNQRRSSDDDPIVLYRFYQFSCSCQGKVWFSPLHRAREGCYCRDCHKFVKPFGHIDGLTPYMGHELCYAKFQCHHCGRSWSCQKSRSNFPDNCFSCGRIVYPYYQVSHSVLRRKITRQSDNGAIRSFRNWTYSASSSSVDDDESYQEVLRHVSPQSQAAAEVTPTRTPIGSGKISVGASEGTRTSSASNVCLLETCNQNQNRMLHLPGGKRFSLPCRSLSDTVLVIGDRHHVHHSHQQRGTLNKGEQGRTGFGLRPHHHHRK